MTTDVSVCNSVVCLAWPCVQTLYRNLALAMVAAIPSIAGGIEQAVVDATFFAAYGTAYLPYLMAWRGNWNVIVIEVVIDEIPVPYYVPGGAWAVELAACLLNDPSCIDERVCTQRQPYTG